MLDPDGVRRRSRTVVVGAFLEVVVVIVSLLAVIAWVGTMVWGLAF